MSNLDDDTKKMIVGALIGAALSLGLVYMATRGRKEKGAGDLLGKAMSVVSDILKDHNITAPQSLFKEVEKTVCKNESTISDALEWAAAGLHLWKKMKKG